MYCSTCGSRVPEGRTRCDTCGAPVTAASGYGVPATLAAGPLEHTCPQCGYHGPGVSYFSRSGPMLGLLLLIALTAFPFMGAGGLIFYLMRYNHRVCPRCGFSWGKRGELALPPGTQGAVAALPAGVEAEGGGWHWMQGGAYLLFAFAAMMFMVAFGEGEPVAGMFGIFASGGGAWMLHGANQAREERRGTLLVALQQPVLRLAGDKGGRLTVTEVASSLNWPMRRAEKVLNSLEDGLRVVSDVTDKGVIVYEFRELLHAPSPRLSAGQMDAMLEPGAPGEEKDKLRA